MEKNKSWIKKLVKTGKEVIVLCRKVGVEPVLYGSFLYVAYTKDASLQINDLDFYVPEKSFKKIILELVRKKIEHIYTPKWHTLSIVLNKVKVELDSMDYWYKGKVDTAPFNFNGIRINALTKEALTAIYKRASEVSDQPEKNRKKYEALMKTNR